MKIGIVLAMLFLLIGCQQPSIQTETSSIQARSTTPFSNNWPYGSPSSFAERKALIDNGTLHDGMTKAEAEAILGPPTGEMNGKLDWYHNPGGRWHVAAYFCAELREGKLYNWNTGNK